ncbi:MAG TPA: cyclic nucleotide-binding domain-containing protein [Gemmataceae bacterium]|nr:cyclic nucleotide-binding domain-containing protein [Gemmataceae bacterium]
MGKAKELMPSADLLPRDGDVELSSEQMAKLSLFAGLKGKTDLEKFPGAIRVRHYLSGDAICRQGEPGWTAFYILTAADVENVIQAKPAGAPSGPVYRRSIEDLVLLPEGADEDIYATIYLSIPRRATSSNRGWLGRLNRRLFGGTTPGAAKGRPKFIPIDAPTDVDGETLQAFLRAGDLFGEMSCLNRSPRSATIIAARECYVLEILRNIFEKIKEDANYKKKVEEEYKRRALDQQIRNLPLFSDLTDSQIETVRKRATVKSYKAGQILCDEHDTSDDVFLIRSGLVKVVKGASALLSVRDLADPAALHAALAAAAGPAAKLVAGFPEEVKAILAMPANRVTAANEQQIVQVLNRSIKGPPLWTDPAFKPLAEKPEFQERIKRLPADQKDWTERRDGRRLNRRLVDAALPGIHPLPRSVEGLETILGYRARGELIGEMGLLRGLSRSASCIAYIHERDELARKEAAKRDLEAVEVVHLPAALFEELLRDPKFGRKVDSILAERLASDKQAITGPVAAPLQSERFNELGLIQGQRLMLIDLDRCTRCDECVKACINSHDDGRSRLFLDGPRFGQYLVPTTCRSCLDPVCMIGCPVGSIHRGDNGQIVIEDWCIGCEMCARQCPYGSIVMHDTGVIPEGAYGWQFFPSDEPLDGSTLTKRYKTGKSGSGPPAWRPIKAPVSLNRDLLAGGRPAAGYAFRFELTLDQGRLAEGDEFKLEVTAPQAAKVQVWVDGKPLDPEEVKRDKRTYPVPEALRVLKPGRHVVAAWVSPPAGHAGPIFDLRGDVVRRPKAAQLNAADYVEKGVTEVAVVCDLCSTLPGKVPSCVRACPHDAAMRVDARRNFPA